METSKSKIRSYFISTSPNVNQDQVRELLRPYMLNSIPSEFMDGFKEEEFYVNPTGNFVIGGPDGDCGLTGRKIIVDTYGGAAPHGGGAFQEKTQLKLIDLRRMQQDILQKILLLQKADKCLIQLAYYWSFKTFINLCKPFDNDFDKNKFVVEKIKENFDLSPRGIREMLGLNKPIYEKTSAYGHFGRVPEKDGSFSWENTDKIKFFSK